jgi:hypothetical protein
MLHRSYLCSIARPAIHSHPKNRHAVPSPRISEWTRVDMTRSTLSRTHSVTEAAAPTTVSRVLLSEGVGVSVFCDHR